MSRQAALGSIQESIWMLRKLVGKQLIITENLPEVAKQEITNEVVVDLSRDNLDGLEFCNLEGEPNYLPPSLKYSISHFLAEETEENN